MSQNKVIELPSGHIVPGFALIDPASGAPIGSNASRLPIEPLGALILNTAVTAGVAATAATVLQAATKRVSVQSSGAACRFAFGTSAAGARRRQESVLQRGRTHAVRASRPLLFTIRLPGDLPGAWPGCDR